MKEKNQVNMRDLLENTLPVADKKVNEEGVGEHEELNNLLNSLSDAQIEEAFEAMLIDIRSKRTALSDISRTDEDFARALRLILAEV